MTAPPSGTVTFLFTDIEGSTRLWEERPEEMRSALEEHDRVLRHAIEAHGGYVFSTGGDGFGAAFSRAAGALDAARTAQAELAGHPFVRVRMGLHIGEADERNGDYFGPAVNRAARIMAAGHGGQVLVSRTTAALLEGAELVDLGEHRLRDLSSQEHVFQLGTDSFPPLRTVGAYPHNLPLQLDEFVGRDAEVEELVSLLAESRLVTLTGVGGVGKTRLALQTSADALPRFADGAWLVELATVDANDDVAATAARVLGVQPTGSGQMLDRLVGALRDQELLVVLDNCEHVLDGAARLAEGLVSRCPDVRVLATSREGLGVRGEHLVAVRSLGLPNAEVDRAGLLASEAGRLFVDRASARGEFVVSEAEAATLTKLVRRLDGIPLAIELAAARVHAMGPATLLAGLDHRFRVLTAGSRTALERHQTLRNTIDWSYDLLQPSTQAVFRRLAVFAGGFDLDAAQAVCTSDDLDEWDVAEELSALVDKSLVVADPTAGGARYRMLETIAQYALEKLVAGGGADPVRDRHAHHYLAVVERLRPLIEASGEATWGPLLDREMPNTSLAVQRFLDRDDADRACRVVRATAFWGNSFGYDSLRMANQVATNFDDFADTSDDHPLAGATLLWAVMSRWLQEGVAPSRQLASLDRVERLEARKATVDSMVGAQMPFIYLSTDEPDRARMWLERLEAAPVETLDYWYLYAALLVALTDALAETPPARLDALSRAVHAQGTESSHVGQLAIVEGTLNQTDDPQRALECFDRAAETGRAVGNYFIEEAGIGRSSWPLLRMRRRPDAIERAVRMLELVRRRGNPTNAMVNGAAIPALLAATGAYDVAVMFVELHRQHVPSSAHVVERLLRETGYWERLQRPELDHARSEAIHTTPAELVDLTIAALDPARIKPT